MRRNFAISHAVSRLTGTGTREEVLLELLKTELVIRMWVKRTDTALIVIVAVILGIMVWISSSHLAASIGVTVAAAATFWIACGFIHGFHSPK